jgi:Uma2 family endonuclease
MVAESTTPKRPISHGNWTYAELLALDNEHGAEIYDGELVIMTAPKYRHQRALRRLLLILEPFVQQQGDGGEFFYPPHDLYVSPREVYEPDLSFVAKARFAQEQVISEDDGRMLVPPDLIVEIISPSTARRDRVDKFNAYAAFGVRHYWLIDPDECILQAFVLDNGRYAAEAALGTEDIFEPSLFPGLRILLSQLFEN